MFFVSSWNLRLPWPHFGLFWHLFPLFEPTFYLYVSWFLAWSLWCGRPSSSMHSTIFINPSKCPRCESFDKLFSKPKVSIHERNLISWQTPFLRGLKSTFVWMFTHSRPRSPLHPLRWTLTIPSHPSTLSGVTWTFHLVIVWIFPMWRFQIGWVSIIF
jgi:hypothetical protein